MSKSDAKVIKLRLIIDHFSEQLANSDYYKISFLSALKRCTRALEEQQRKISKIVCYGLGSFSDSIHPYPKYQLALLLLLCKQLDSFILDRTILIFDPAFVQEDIKLLESYDEPNFLLIPDNEYCARGVDNHEEAGDSFTFFFMPHLHKFFYNNLIGANWSKDQVGRLIVFGNSFGSMIDNELFVSVLEKLKFLDYAVNGFSKVKDRPSSGKRKIKNHRKAKRKDKPDRSNRENGLFLEAPVDDCDFYDCGLNDLSFNWPNTEVLEKLPATLFVQTLYSDWLVTLIDHDLSPPPSD